MAAVREMVLGRFLSAGFRARRTDVAQAVGRMLDQTPPRGYAAACAAVRDADLHPVLPSIRARSLVICSDRDESTPADLGKELHACLPGSTLLLLQDAAHLSNIEQSDAFNAAVTRFVQQEEAER